MPAPAIHGNSAGCHARPRQQDYSWMSLAQWQQQHRQQCLQLTQQSADLLWLGDSITAGWPAASLDSALAPWSSLNLAIWGDHTGNLLWRWQHQPLQARQPRLMVLMVGINNLLSLDESAAQTHAGIRCLLQAMQQRYPHSAILLQALLPSGETPDLALRAQITELNRQLARLAAEHDCHFRDDGALFIEPDGTINPALMADFLHPTLAGYARWQGPLLQQVRALLAADSKATKI